MPTHPIPRGLLCESCHLPLAVLCRVRARKGAEQHGCGARRGRVDALLAQRADIHEGIAASVSVGTMTADFAAQDLAARAGMRALEDNLASERALLRDFQADLFTHVRCLSGPSAASSCVWPAALFTSLLRVSEAESSASAAVPTLISVPVHTFACR